MLEEWLLMLVIFASVWILLELSLFTKRWMDVDSFGDFFNVNILFCIMSAVLTGLIAWIIHLARTEPEFFKFSMIFTGSLLGLVLLKVMLYNLYMKSGERE